METKKIVGLGNALADILIRIPADDLLEQLGFGRGSMNLVGHETHRHIARLTEGLAHTVVSGGSAANTVRGLAQLGVEASYIGKIGRDRVGAFLQGEFHSLGVRPQLIHSQTPTGQSMILISPDGERTMATFLGAAIELAPEEITPRLFEGYDLVHIEGYLVQDHALIRRAVQTARAAGLQVSLDLASYNVVEENLEVLHELAEGVDILFANEEEARAFTGAEPAAAAEELARRCGIAVVKVGAHGSLIAAGDERIAIEAVPAEVVDTTGAGDLYAAGFLYGFSQGHDLRRSGEIGSLVAARAIESVGTAIPEEVMQTICRELARR